ncbi:LytR/AlgR family response regulator transcription factor [Thermophagus xiamenensis]|uniref:Two component transcriptional regulator, LytTR family n=1 Tax=Thermophagus xiamenensis TaxID=385682 RepID=A0A1I2E5U6_9BACT|nr:LytTR family DNA-binding domain-containing protein [Thermophagus xiamenensis]SFE88053.1 two component transcriptional regulator, LytTR family [Thermophagus xiamenensis]
MKKILVVEDEPLMQRIIRAVILQHFPEFQLLDGVSTVADAWASIKANAPDLVLLDIGLPDGTAFDLLRKVEFFDFKVVFLSGHEDYLVEAVRFSAASYVLKPFDLSELVFAIDKACDAMEESEYQSRMEILLTNAKLPASARTVVFPTTESSKAVPLSSILYGEAVAGGCIIYDDSLEKIFVPRPLRYYEQMFGKYGFYRCHPLYVVNLRKVFKVEENSLIIATGNESTKIPLDPRKYNVVKQRFMEVE